MNDPDAVRTATLLDCATCKGHVEIQIRPEGPTPLDRLRPVPSFVRSHIAGCPGRLISVADLPLDYHGFSKGEKLS